MHVSLLIIHGLIWSGYLTIISTYVWVFYYIIEIRRFCFENQFVLYKHGISNWFSLLPISRKALTYIRWYILAVKLIGNREQLQNLNRNKLMDFVYPFVSINGIYSEFSQRVQCFPAFIPPPPPPTPFRIFRPPPHTPLYFGTASIVDPGGGGWVRLIVSRVVYQTILAKIGIWFSNLSRPVVFVVHYPHWINIVSGEWERLHSSPPHSVKSPQKGFLSSIPQ